jgi:hypothetical protein
MKNVLKLEELAQLLGCIALLAMNGVPWWAYLILVMGPDISMLGYLVGTRLGAFTYNLVPSQSLLHYWWAASARNSLMLSLVDSTPAMSKVLMLAGIILYGHSSLDRLLGYGLKFSDGFQHTHLGWIGKGQQEK